jgi:hypothetical protein
MKPLDISSDFGLILEVQCLDKLVPRKKAENNLELSIRKGIGIYIGYNEKDWGVRVNPVYKGYRGLRNYCLFHPIPNNR